MSSNKVFVAQDSGHNYTPAMKFGEVVLLTTREIVPYAGSSTNVELVHAIESGLAKEYEPGVDYLLPTGSILAIAHMFAAAFDLGTRHNILKWDARAHCYYEYVLVTPRGKK